jgi:hypothetical protein
MRIEDIYGGKIVFKPKNCILRNKIIADGKNDEKK